MDRRAFLVALTPLVAGCFGGQRSQPTATSTETPESTPTETPEPTPTETPEPTATPEPEASPEAAQHIDDAQDRLTESVYVYTGGVTDDLLSVTAETEEFRARDVLLRLDRVQRAIAAAEADATTDEQRATIASLDSTHRARRASPRVRRRTVSTGRQRRHGDVFVPARQTIACYDGNGEIA